MGAASLLGTAASDSHATIHLVNPSTVTDLTSGGAIDLDFDGVTDVSGAKSADYGVKRVAVVFAGGVQVPSSVDCLAKAYVMGASGFYVRCAVGSSATNGTHKGGGDEGPAGTFPVREGY